MINTQDKLGAQLGHALNNLKFEHLPPDVIHGAKRTLLDTLGAILVGISTEEVQRLCQAVEAWGSSGQYHVWGSDRQFAAPHAALVNGTAAHAREVDDFGGCGHSGAVVIPAVLAAAQYTPCSGKQLLTAIVAGYEIAVRVTDAVGGYRIHNKHGWHSTGTTGVFGAAAAAALVLRLTPRQMTWALGLAATYTGGIWAFIVDGAMSKRLHAGKAAETGLVAALLAQFGFTGPTAVFEDTWGSFLNTYAPEDRNPAALTHDLDAAWTGIFRSGFKPYACCRGIHSTLDATFQLKQQHNLTPDDVDEILVHGSYQTRRQLGKQEVDTILDAQFSIPYSVTLALIVGKAGLNEYEESYFRDPQLTAFAHKVRVLEDDRSIEAQPTVQINLRDGRTLENTVEIARGDSRNPMSDDELQEKFLANAARSVNRRRLQQIADIIWRLEELENMSPLFESLKPQPPA